MGLRVINGRAYYYEFRRESGRVRSIYRGKGKVAENVAAIESILRGARTDDRRAWLAEKEGLDARDKALNELHKAGEAAAAEHLESLGYRRHDRGHWRRKRMMTPAKVEVASPPAAGERAAIAALRRCQVGDASALPALRALLDAAPEPAAVFVSNGIEARAKNAAMKAYTKDTDLLSPEIFRREVAAVEAELAGVDPSPLVRLLARRAALSWYHLNAEEASFAIDRPGSRVDHSEYRLRLIDRRHRQFLSAVKCLALVRRLESGGGSVKVTATATATRTLSVEVTA